MDTPSRFNYCRTGYGSEPDVAPSQHFEIRHTACNGQTRWAFYWNSALKTCQLVDGSGGYPSVRAESKGTDPQQLDIHFDDLEYRIYGGSWTDWGADTYPCEDTTWYLLAGGGISYSMTER